MKGRPPVDRSRLHVAVELIRNGATIGEAARAAGVNRNTLSRYGILKGAIKALQEDYVIPPTPRIERDVIEERIYEIEKSIAASVRSLIHRRHVPLIATVEAAQMESDRLQVAVRVERLQKEARRLTNT